MPCHHPHSHQSKPLLHKILFLLFLYQDNGGEEWEKWVDDDGNVGVDNGNILRMRKRNWLCDIVFVVHLVHTVEIMLSF